MDPICALPAAVMVKADNKGINGQAGKSEIPHFAVDLSKSSLTLNVATLSATFTVTRLGDGAINVTSSAANVATVTLSAGRGEGGRIGPGVGAGGRAAHGQLGGVVAGPHRGLRVRGGRDQPQRPRK